MMFITVGVTVLMWVLAKIDIKLKAALTILAACIFAGLYFGSGKAWGVILMAAAIVCFFLLPWLDRSPVLSIRYRSMPIFCLRLLRHEVRNRSSHLNSTDLHSDLLHVLRVNALVYQHW